MPDSGLPTSAPCLRVHPRRHRDLGKRLPGEAVFGRFRLENQRARPITVQAIDSAPPPCADGPGPCVVARAGHWDLTQPVEISPGDVVDVQLRAEVLEPGLFDFSFELEADCLDTVDSSDLRLSWEGTSEAVTCLPSRIDLGSMDLEAEVVRTLVCRNQGEQNTLFVARPEGLPSLTISGLGPSLDPGRSARLNVSVRPATAGPVVGQVLFSGPLTPVPSDVSLRGEAERKPPCTDLSLSTMGEASNVELSSGAAGRWTLVLRNGGPAPCSVSSIVVRGEGRPSLRLVYGEESDLLIPPGDEFEFYVETSGRLGPGVRVRGSVEVYAAGRNGSLSLDLEARVPALALLLVPTRLAFEDALIGCPARPQRVRLYATSSAQVIIRGVEISGSDAFSVPAWDEDRVLSPGASLDLNVTFEPTGVGTATATVVVVTEEDGILQRYSVPVMGTAVAEIIETSTFQTLGPPQVNLLAVVDPSLPAARVQALAGAIVSGLSRNDLHLGMTTSGVGDLQPSGRLLPLDEGSAPDRMLKSASIPDFGPAVSNRLVSALSVAPPAEQGMEAMYQALSVPNILGHNLGLLRTSGLFLALFISARPDRSPRPVDFYVNFLLSINPSRGASAIYTVGGPSGGCEVDGLQVQDTSDYRTMAERVAAWGRAATAQRFVSLCETDAALQLERALRAATGPRSRFYLSSEPREPESIEIEIEGAPFPRASPAGEIQWRYLEDRQAVDVLVESVLLETGRMIRARYPRACDPQ